MSTLYSFRVPNRVEVLVHTGDETPTIQSAKAECDINNILRQFSNTGILEHINNQTGEYIDLPPVYDYQAALNIVADGQYAFSTLPSKVRDHFGNDPANFLAAFLDPSQAPQLREWGLLRPDATSQASSAGGGSAGDSPPAASGSGGA